MCQGQPLLEKRVSFACKDNSIDKVLKAVGEKEGINFSYQANLAVLRRNVSINVNNVSVKTFLDLVLENTGLGFQEFGKQIIIFPRRDEKRKKILVGQVCDALTKEGIPYAAIELRKTHTGIITDDKGRFKIELEQFSPDDSLYVTSLSYNKQVYSISSFGGIDKLTFYLTIKSIDVPAVSVIGKPGKFEKKGNKSWFSRGSLYMDTHGQQTALYISNPDTFKGTISKVNYYLSGKGNTDAPFRVRIYNRDTITGKPAKDLLPEIVVVKPVNGSGWFSVNVSRFEIPIPQDGFFVAMEGVFPNDFEYYFEGSGFKDINSENEEDGDDFAPENITYGQQLGYSRGSENNTWHYSIDHRWFQLKKRHFNVMITAELKVEKKRLKRGLLGWLGLK